ncbi:MAG: hypothetical protein GX258_03130 [Clostridiales bacterium]|mgnify:CR=1 FL=1|nr:hypothetical protein [Clostridiales bacterium]
MQKLLNHQEKWNKKRGGNEYVKKIYNLKLSSLVNLLSALAIAVVIFNGSNGYIGIRNVNDNMTKMYHIMRK